MFNVVAEFTKLELYITSSVAAFYQTVEVDGGAENKKKQNNNKKNFITNHTQR